MSKNIFKYCQAVFCMALALSFNACTDEVEYTPAPVLTEGVQAYFYNGAQTSFTLLPEDEQKVQVSIYRESTEAATVHLTGDNENFTFPTSIDFQEGEKNKAFDVALDIEIGESADLTLKIADEDTYVYGPAEITISVTRDYTWVSAGTADYTDNSFGLGTGKVSIEHANEVPGLYRLKNLYQALSGDPSMPALSLQFTLDENYQAESITPMGTFIDLGVGYWFYYDPVNYASYCYFTNEGNVFNIGILMTPDQSNLYIGADSFVWNGWPGEEAN